MSHVDVIRAWKDEAYRMGLSEAERAKLPKSPIGSIELSDTELGSVAGGLPRLPTVDYCTFDYFCDTWFFCD